MEKRTIEDDVYFGTMKGFIDMGKSVSMTPKGFSMLPFIRGERDSVVIGPVCEPLQVGDIILARIGSRYVMHRIIALDADRITMMGDGNLRGVEHCLAGEVIGKVTEIVGSNGRHAKPGKGTLWRHLLPFRRYLLAIYKRTLFKL